MLSVLFAAALAAPPPGGPAFTVTVDGALRAGAVARFRVDGAPEGPVRLLASDKARGGPCPGVLDGACVDLTKARVLAEGVADPGGAAPLEVVLPDRLPPVLYLQAVAPGAVSEPVAVDLAGPPCDYVGPWPCNPYRDTLASPLWGPDFDTWPRLEGPDQYGDVVDTYDWLGQGVPTLAVVVAEWAAPSEDYVRWLTGGGPPVIGFDWSDALPTAVRDGALQAVVFVVQDEGGGPADAGDAADVAGWLGPTEVAVIADEAELHLVGHDAFWLPQVYLIDDDGALIAWDDTGYAELTAWLDARL